MKQSIIMALTLLLVLFLIGGAAAEEAQKLPDMDVILPELGEEAYIETYRYLQEGNSIRKGDKSDYGKALQTLLSQAGYSITIDGSIGAKSIGVLNTVQEALGLKTTNAVNAECFRSLATFLWCIRFPDKAEITAAELNSDEMWHYAGCARMKEGRYWLAKQCFEKSGSKVSAKAVKKCAQSSPVSKELFHRSSTETNRCSVFLREQKDSGIAMMKIMDEAGNTVSLLILTRKGKVTCDLPEGAYMMQIAHGTVWYGSVDAFGEDGMYAQMVFNGSVKIELVMGHEYSLYVNPKDMDANAVNMTLEPITWQEFIQ